MPPKGSHGSRPIAIELVGPLVDDRGAMTRTLLDVVRKAGVELRPGSLEQVAGAAVGWAMATLLEGHGRHDVSQVDITARARATLEGVARTTPVDLAGGAAVWWQAQQAAQRELLVFTGLPRATALVLGERAGLGDLGPILLGADGEDGLPRPDALVRELASRGIAPPDLVVAAGTPAALLAALASGIGHVVLVGAGNSAAAMLAEQRVERLDQIDGP